MHNDAILLLEEEHRVDGVDVDVDEHYIGTILAYTDSHLLLLGCILTDLVHFEIFLNCKEYQGSSCGDHLIAKWNTMDEPS